MSLGNSHSEDKAQELVRVAQHDQQLKLLCGRMFDASWYSREGIELEDRRLSQGVNEVWEEILCRKYGQWEAFIRGIFIRGG